MASIVLVMDLHKEINRLQALIAEEEIAGARAYGITAADRPLIKAFMTGVQQTAPMKFDHPGLATTAARSGDTLLIQNDIGATEAHVIVLRVSGLTAALTYTDVHAQRLRFFQNALATTGIVWEDLHSRQVSGLGKEDLFYVTIGRMAASDDAGLRAFLERLGSRIVFLIDWNRARKRLGLLVPNALAVDLLNWAAEHDLGHRAFLQLGGERLIYDALEQAVRTPLRYGEKLHEMLGAEAACDYLRFVLETAAERVARRPLRNADPRPESALSSSTISTPRSSVFSPRAAGTPQSSSAWQTACAGRCSKAGPRECNRRAENGAARQSSSRARPTRW